MKKIEPLIVPVVCLALTFFWGLWLGGYWEKSPPDFTVTKAVSDFLESPLEHYHGLRTKNVSVPDAVEAFILNASPVLKQPERGEGAGNREQEKILPPEPPEPVKKEPPRRGIFRRR